MAYGEKIAQLRRENNMTQAQLGAALNVSPQAVSKWERDSAEPDLYTLKQICSLFNVSVDDLLDITAPTKKTEVSPQPIDQEKLARDVAGNVKSALKEHEKPIGYCKECGTIVTSSTVGKTSPYILCKNCVDKHNQAAQAKLEQEIGQLKKTRNRSFFWSALAAIIFLTIGAYTLKIGDYQDDLAYMVPLLIFLTYGVFAMVSECIIGDGPVADIIIWFIARPIKFPGIIFSWDLDGLLFLIVLKILFAVLGFLLGVLFFFIGITIGVLVAPFTYPFHIVPLCRTIRKGKAVLR